MFRINVLACFLLWTTGVWAADSGYPKHGRIKFEKRRVNFGKVFRGEQLSHIFVFKNVGKGDLSVHGVHASCGCTAVEINKNKQYKPGENGQLEVVFDTSDFSGKITKVVTVITNEKVLPDRTLTLGATVKSEFDVKPPLFSFGNSKSGDSPSKIVKISPLNKFAIQVEAVEFNNDLVEVTHRQIGNDWELKATLKSGQNSGFIKDNIFVKTNSKYMPRLRVPLRANIRGYVEYKPDYLEFGAIGAGSKSTRSLTLHGNSAVKILGSRAALVINGKPVEDSAKYISIQSLPHEKKRRLVAIELINATKIIGNVHGKLYLLTDHKKQEEIAVDFYAFFR